MLRHRRVVVGGRPTLGSNSSCFQVLLKGMLIQAHHTCTRHVIFSVVYHCDGKKRSVPPPSQRRQMPPIRITTREYRLRRTSKWSTAAPSTPQAAFQRHNFSSRSFSSLASFPARAVAEQLRHEPCHPPSQASRVAADGQRWQAETVTRRAGSGLAQIHLLPQTPGAGFCLRLIDSSLNYILRDINFAHHMIPFVLSKAPSDVNKLLKVITLHSSVQQVSCVVIFISVQMGPHQSVSLEKASRRQQMLTYSYNESTGR